MLIATVAVITAVRIANDLYNEQLQPLQTYAWSLPYLFAIVLPCFAAYRIFLAPFFSANRHLPTVQQGPVLKRLFKEPNSIDFLRWIEQTPNDGLIRFYGVLNGERLLVTTTQGTKIVHDGDTKDFHRPPAAKAILTRLTGGAIFAAEGREHAAHRREMTPAFKHRHLKELYPTFWSKTVELVQSLQQHCNTPSGNTVIEIDDWVSRGTLDAIALAGFGFDFNSIAKPYSELVRKYRQAFLPGKSAARIRILANIVPIKILFRLPMKRNRDAKACIQAIRSATFEVVQKRQIESAEKKQSGQDILAVMLESPLFKDNTDLMVSQCMAFLAAGHEASALALGWTLYELSLDQQRQAKLREEIRANLPAPGSGVQVEASQIDRLEYLEAVVQESLRKWGPVPRQTRVSPRAMTVSNHVVPKNTPLVVSFYAMNRMQENWGSDAAEFKPERWLGSGEAKALGGAKDRFCFSTFSHGARSCIGQRFAHYEVLVFLAGLVGVFEWSFVEKEGLPKGMVEADHDSTVMLKVADGLQLAVKAIDGW
jgi:cytochrome P450